MEKNAQRLYRIRYHAGQRLHLAEIDVAHDADVVVDNDDLAHPVLRFLSCGPGDRS